ncbi:MAG: TIGR02678 family protein [Myxococcales bacterium]
MRCLLMHPLLTARGPFASELVLVRRHAAWLREWLASFPGWTLVVDPELARLCKTPADLADSTRAACDSGGEPFSRRRYVLACLALAALERSDRQTTLGNLAKEIELLCGAEPALAQAGIVFDLSLHEVRRDMVEVVRLLLSLQVLVRVQGEELQYLQDKGDVLYTVQRPALASLLQVQRSPSTVEQTGFLQRLEALAVPPVPATDEARNRKLRTSLVQRLLDDPVVYYQDLTDEERAYLTGQRHLLLSEIEKATGLVPEIRREGIAMVDGRGDLSDAGFPDEGTDGHVALLLAEHLAERANRSPTSVVPGAELEALVASLAKQHKSHWRKDASEPGAEVALTATALDRLAKLRLVRKTSEGVIPLPAIARYTLEPLAEDAAPAPGARGKQLGLFGGK